MVQQRKQGSQELARYQHQSGAIQQLTQAGVVAPQVSPQDARQAAQMFQQLKEAVLGDTDYIWAVGGTSIYTDRHQAEVQAKRGKSPLKGHPKKSGCLKLATAFGLRVEVVREEWGANGEYVDVIARATHPCGASTEDLASCERNERSSKKGLSRHNMRSTAFTRARNRAILALIGGGEVSGEELTAGGEIDPGEYVSPGAMQPYQRQPQPASQSWAHEKSDVEGQMAPPEPTKSRGRPVGVQAPSHKEEWNELMRRVHAAARDFSLDHSDIHKILNVDSLKDAAPEDLRDFPGMLEMWKAADRSNGIEQEMSALREDLEGAESLNEMAERWKAWVKKTKRAISPLGTLYAERIKDGLKDAWAQDATNTEGGE